MNSTNQRIHTPYYSSNTVRQQLCSPQLATPTYLKSKPPCTRITATIATGTELYYLGQLSHYWRECYRRSTVDARRRPTFELPCNRFLDMCISARTYHLFGVRVERNGLGLHVTRVQTYVGDLRLRKRSPRNKQITELCLACMHAVGRGGGERAHSAGELNLSISSLSTVVPVPCKVTRSIAPCSGHGKVCVWLDGQSHQRKERSG